MMLTRSRTSAKCRLSLCSLLRILSISHWRSSIIVSRTDTRDSAVSTLSCSFENYNKKNVTDSILNKVNIFWDCSALIFLLYIIPRTHAPSTHLLLWQQNNQWTALNFMQAENPTWKYDNIENGESANLAISDRTCYLFNLPYVQLFQRLMHLSVT